MQGRRLILALTTGAAALALTVTTVASASPNEPGSGAASKLTPAQISAAPGKRAAYRKYVACKTVVEAPPARRCKAKDDKGAFFRSNLKTVRYNVCVRFPSRKVLCAKRQKANQGELYVNKITSSATGVHVVTWWVKGKKVGRFKFRVTG